MRRRLGLTLVMAAAVLSIPTPAAAVEPMPYDEYMANIDERNSNLDASVWADVDGTDDIRLAALLTASTYETFLRNTQPEPCYVGLYALHWQLYSHYVDMAYATNMDMLDAAFQATQDDFALMDAMLPSIDCPGDNVLEGEVVLPSFTP